jgi:uncharacterized RDD family membrane protein YckC
MENNNKVKGAKLGGRIGAYLLDRLIIYAAYMIIGVIITLAAGAEEITAAAFSTEYASVSAPYRMMMLALPLVAFVYGVLMESGKKSATVGKRAAGLKVVFADGGSIRVLDAVVRNIIKVLPQLLTAVFVGNSVVSLIAGALIIAYYIVPLCNKNHRGIHDFVAGTTVVKANEVQNMQQVQEIPPINIKLPEPSAAETPAFENLENLEKTVAPQAKRKLMCISGQYNDAEFPLDMPVIMGRDSSGCNVIFDNKTEGVSRLHCSVRVEESKVYLQDLGSTYGTIVNDSTALRANETVELQAGDRFKIGKNEIFVLK